MMIATHGHLTGRACILRQTAAHLQSIFDLLNLQIRKIDPIDDESEEVMGALALVRLGGDQCQEITRTITELNEMADDLLHKERRSAGKEK